MFYAIFGFVGANSIYFAYANDIYFAYAKYVILKD